MTLANNEACDSTAEVIKGVPPERDAEKALWKSTTQIMSTTKFGAQASRRVFFLKLSLVSVLAMIYDISCGYKRDILGLRSRTNPPRMPVQRGKPAWAGSRKSPPKTQLEAPTLTHSRDQDEPPLTDTPPNQRLQAVRDFVLQNINLSTLKDLDRAVEFMAVKDKRQLEIPTGGEKADEFITRYVLAALYYHTDDEGWRDELNFLSEKPHCSWHKTVQSDDRLHASKEYKGVACNEDGEVVALYLAENGLSGCLPHELGLLTTLTHLDFDLNILWFDIPSSYKALTNLESIISGWTGWDGGGTFPSWIGALTKLRNIDFSNSGYYGSLPESLSNLTQLERLTLNSNELTGTIPKLDKLTKLERFLVDHNRLTGSLVTLASNNLVSIDVSSNELTGSVPSLYFSLPKLNVLDLHGNNFTTFPSTMEENTKLELLALQDCKFQSQPLPSTISNLKALAYLNISSSGFTGALPASVGDMTQLKALVMAKADFDHLPEWMSNLTALKVLLPGQMGAMSEGSYAISRMKTAASLGLDNTDLTLNVSSFPSV